MFLLEIDQNDVCSPKIRNFNIICTKKWGTKFPRNYIQLSCNEKGASIILSFFFGTKFLGVQFFWLEVLIEL